MYACFCASNLIHCTCDHTLMCCTCESVRYVCVRARLCFTCKCGRGCVSVFSLVNVVKRGLISSNVIHTVTSHYAHIPATLSVSLLPSLPSFSPSVTSPFPLPPLFMTPPSCSSTLCAPHQKIKPASCCLGPLDTCLPSFARLPCSPHLGFSPLSLSHPHTTFHRISTSSVIIPSPRWTFSVLLFFTSRAWSDCLRISTQQPSSLDSLVNAK